MTETDEVAQIGEVALDGGHAELAGVGQCRRIAIYRYNFHALSELIQQPAGVSPATECRVHHDTRQHRGQQPSHLMLQNRPVVVPVVVVPVLAHCQPPGRWYQLEAGGVRGLPLVPGGWR